MRQHTRIGFSAFSGVAISMTMATCSMVIGSSGEGQVARSNLREDRQGSSHLKTPNDSCQWQENKVGVTTEGTSGCSRRVGGIKILMRFNSKRVLWSLPILLLELRWKLLSGAAHLDV